MAASTSIRQLVTASLLYFLQVFLAGFALALIRIPFLVPRFGERTAELMEMPIIWIVIGWVAYRLARRCPDCSRGRRLAVGGLALVLMVGAELVVALGLGNQDLAAYIASRDPVSGSVYLLGLVWFAVAPAIWTPRK